MSELSTPDEMVEEEPMQVDEEPMEESMPMGLMSRRNV